tara:strand:+ start:2582 stop:3199 length:618 start_codon:yes stop_codon:yes gene_type:complete
MKLPVVPMKRNLNLLNNLDNIEEMNLLMNNYKKTITHSKFLKEEKISEIFNYNIDIIPTHFHANFSLNTITNLILKKVRPRNLKNEILFLLNKKVKVYIHIEQLFRKTNIYHIGITFKSVGGNVRYDIHGFNIDNLYNLLSYNLYSKTIFWNYSNKTIKEIIDYEKNLDYRYILGIYDCRHYVKNLTKWACDNPTPVWKLYKLID